jgi:Pleckstrin homology domain
MSNLTRSCADFLSFQSEVTELIPEGTANFSFHYSEDKHTFRANTVSERDTWIEALKQKIEEAKVILLEMKWKVEKLRGRAAKEERPSHPPPPRQKSVPSDEVDPNRAALRK